MSELRIFHASDAFFRNKPEEHYEAFMEYINRKKFDVVVFTGNMGFPEKPRIKHPMVYVEGDFENVEYVYDEPKIIYIANYTALVLPYTPETSDDEFIDNIAGEEVDFIISPAAPLDTHFLKGNRVFDVLFDVAYYRSPKIWLSGHYKFLPYYQSIVPVRNQRKKFCNVFGINTSYGYIEELTLDDKLRIVDFSLKRLFNGEGRKIF